MLSPVVFGLELSVFGLASECSFEAAGAVDPRSTECAEVDSVACSVDPELPQAVSAAMKAMATRPLAMRRCRAPSNSTRGIFGIGVPSNGLSMR
jgi:hypothetical protein